MSAFGRLTVPQKLNELQAHVSGMRAKCDEAESQLQLSNEASKTLLERAGTLRRERLLPKSRILFINESL